MAAVKRVLIVSAKVGAGHLRAAEALEQAFRADYPAVEVKNVDALEFTNPGFRKGFRESYERLVKDAPTVWGMIYESLEKQPTKSATKKLAEYFDRLNSAPLRKLVKKFNPDRVVCTHHLPAEIMGARRRHGKLGAPVFLVLTDYEIHTMWIQEGIDHYCVGAEAMEYALKAKGIGDARVHVTGIPILPVFSEMPADRAAVRKQLGLGAGRRTVLVAAGGFGMMRADQAVALLAERLPETQFLAVAGNNEKLQRQLEKVAARHGGRVIAFGFVTNMHELMAASDIAVAKSGGLTTSECLAAGLPMVVFNPIPGQEERNAVYLLEHGAGVWAHTAAHMIFKVERLLGDEARLKQMQEAAKRLARPDAARTIARLVMEAAPAES